jgi:hypothetical protein
MTNEQIANSFKCRASAIGEIMTNGRSKTDVLGETCKTHLKKWLNSKLYGRDKIFTSKYTDKGIQTEEDGITLIASVRRKFYVKNYEHFSNDFIQGTPDVVYKEENLVIDNKSSYELDTFPMWENDLKNKANEWQVIGYADLVGVQNAMVYYTLNDMPDGMLMEQVQKEKYYNKEITDLELANFVKQRIFTKEKFEFWRSELFPELKKYDFIEIPESKRVKGFEVEVTKEKIEEIHQRVLECRKYILEILN